MPEAANGIGIAQVGYTGTDEDRDRWLTARIWLQRNAVAFDLSRPYRHHCYDLSGSEPKDFLLSDDRYDVLVIHDIWGLTGHGHIAAGGAGMSENHGVAAWATRIAQSGTRFVFLFGGDHGLHGLAGGFTPIAVPAHGMLTVLAAHPWQNPPTATQPIAYREMNQMRLDCLPELLGNRSLDLSYTAASSSHLLALCDMPNLTHLRLVGTAVSDADGPILASCHHLRTLCLDETPISGRILCDVRRLTALRCLSLNETGIDDDGVACLDGLPGLAWLSMVGTTIGDRSVPSLGTISTLTSLSLVGTRMTHRGIEQLRHALPRCAIDAPIANGAP